MAREQKSAAGREASLLDRRAFLTGASGFAASIGLGVVGDRALASTGEPQIDVSSVTADHTWTTVQLSNAHTDPVVVAPSLSYHGSQPASPRIRNVTGDTFEVSVEEWLYLDGRHLDEIVGCLVIDPGNYPLPDGTTVEVGRVRTNHRWESTAFSASFSATPIVFSQPQTVNGRQPVVTRHRNVSQSSIDVRLQEEEAQGPHRVEDVGYLAIDSGSGTLADHAFEAGVQHDVRGTWQTIEFTDTYQRPVFLADLQTYRGTNTCSVRYRNLSESTVDVKVEEERSSDHETTHLGEDVGYLVIDGATGDTPLAELDWSRVERLVHTDINERRAEHGLGALAVDPALREIARYHSKDMAQTDYFSHTAPDGETTSDRYEKFGYDCRADTGNGTYYTGAENIAYTYYDRPVTTTDGTERYTTAEELARGIVRAWMNSEGHRANILMEAWANEGIGVYITAGGKVYATQNFC